MTKMISKYTEEHNLSNESVELTINTGLNVNLFQYFYNKNELFYIFFNKNNTIVKSILGYNLQNYNRFLFRFNDSYNAVEIVNGFDEKINTLENFNMINDLIINARSVRIAIDHDKALKRYDEIKSELNNKNNGNLLDGF